MISQVPNGPLKFHYDWRDERPADETPPYTWRQYILNPDLPEMLIWFPMVKASLRAMDMTEAIMEEKVGNRISKWAVTGGSKRGWTAWLAAAVDPERIKLLVPVVCDFVNFQKTVHHWMKSLGGTPLIQLTYWIEESESFSFGQTFRHLF